MPFSPIQEGKHHIQYSDIPGEVLSPAGLKAGEMAFNVADGKMYMRAAGGNLLTVDGSVSPQWEAFGNAASAPAFIAAAPTSGPAYDMAATPTATFDVTAIPEFYNLRDMRCLANGDLLVFEASAAARIKPDGTLVWSLSDWTAIEGRYWYTPRSIAELPSGNIVTFRSAKAWSSGTGQGVSIITEHDADTGVVVRKAGVAEGLFNLSLANQRYASLRNGMMGEKVYFATRPNSTQVNFWDYLYDDGACVELPYDPASGLNAPNNFSESFQHPNGDVITYQVGGTKVRIWKWDGFDYATISGTPDATANDTVGAVMDGEDVLFIAAKGKKTLRVSPNGSGGYTATVEATRSHTTVTSVEALHVNASGQLQSNVGTFDATGILSPLTPTYTGRAHGLSMQDGSVLAYASDTAFNIIPPPSALTTPNYDYWRKVTRI